MMMMMDDYNDDDEPDVVSPARYKTIESCLGWSGWFPLLSFHFIRIIIQDVIVSAGTSGVIQRGSDKKAKRWEEPKDTNLWHVGLWRARIFWVNRHLVGSLSFFSEQGKLELLDLCVSKAIFWIKFKPCSLCRIRRGTEAARGPKVLSHYETKQWTWKTRFQKYSIKMGSGSSLEGTTSLR